MHTGLGVPGFEHGHRSACVGWRCSAGLEMGHGWSFRVLCQSLCGAEVLSWAKGRILLLLVLQALLGFCVALRCSAGLGMGCVLSFMHLPRCLCGIEVLSWAEGGM